MVADLVAEMAQQRAIRLAHRMADAFAFRIVGLDPGPAFGHARFAEVGNRAVMAAGAAHRGAIVRGHEPIADLVVIVVGADLHLGTLAMAVAPDRGTVSQEAKTIDRRILAERG
jgi:hypothetical protein